LIVSRNILPRHQSVSELAASRFGEAAEKRNKSFHRGQLKRVSAEWSRTEFNQNRAELREGLPEAQQCRQAQVIAGR
jgi:hypothetical protein